MCCSLFALENNNNSKFALLVASAETFLQRLMAVTEADDDDDFWWCTKFKYCHNFFSHSIVIYCFCHAKCKYLAAKSIECFLIIQKKTNLKIKICHIMLKKVSVCLHFLRNDCNDSKCDELSRNSFQKTFYVLAMWAIKKCQKYSA